MYNEYVYHLDLCILAYHLYNQSLIWPFDPWYQRMTKKLTSRRDNTMDQVHKHFDSPDWRKANPSLRGPIEAKGTETVKGKDPIVSDYGLVYPWRPSFSYDGGLYRLFNPPTYITSKIKSTQICQYTDKWSLYVREDELYSRDNGRPTIGAATLNPDNNNNPSDELYCFEGGTGFEPKASKYSFSLMGCILVRVHDNTYDIHIAFRGSQSGSAGRAFTKGLMQGRGNPDWITDMDNQSINTAEPIFAKQPAGFCRGFGAALRACMAPLLTCINHIAADKGNLQPNRIFVTGHSLGGALAALFAGAMVCGGYRRELTAAARVWPWANLTLYTYGSPSVADDSYQQAANLLINGYRFLVGHDPITTAFTKSHVGKTIRMNGGYMGSNTAAHEPAKIRECLIQLSTTLDISLNHVPTEEKDLPWRTFKNFHVMLKVELVKSKLREMLGADFTKRTRLFRDMFSAILPQSSTWKSAITSSTSSDRQRRLNSVFDSNVHKSINMSYAQHVETKVRPLFWATDVKKDSVMEDGVDRYLALLVAVCDFRDDAHITVEELLSLDASRLEI